MKKTIVNSPQAPTPIGPYNQAVWMGDILYVSGQIALHPTTKELIMSSITAETTQVMENIKAILHQAEIDFSHVVKTTIFLSDMSLFTEVNEVYAKYFSADFPARETVAVKGLPKDANVEISVIAHR